MNKKGFIATSLIYSFFLVFCAMIAGYVAINIHNKMLLNRVIEQIREDLNTTKYITDIPVGSYVKVNVKYAIDGNEIDISDLNYNVLYTSGSKVVLVSNGIAFSLPKETNNIYPLTNDAINNQLFNFSNSCVSSYRTLSFDDFDNILSTNDTDLIKTFLNVNIKYVILNAPSVNYFSYIPEYDQLASEVPIDRFTGILAEEVTDNIDENEPVGVRLILQMEPIYEIKGGEGTDLSPYVLESRCAK